MIKIMFYPFTPHANAVYNTSIYAFYFHTPIPLTHILSLYFVLTIKE